MSSLKFLCPACNQKLEADDDMLGTVIECPVCGVDIAVPSGDEADPDTDEAAAYQGQRITPRPVGGTLVLPIGWTFFGFGAITLLLAAAFKWPLPSPLFLAVGCALGALAIYRQRKVQGYALVVCTMLLLPLSLVLVAHAFAARAEAKFGEPAPRTSMPPAPPAPAPTPPESANSGDTGRQVTRIKTTPNARRVLTPAEPPTDETTTAPESKVEEPPPEDDSGPPAPPERTLTAAERKKIFELFMDADERATREVEKAEEDSESKSGRRDKAKLQMQLAARYKREIEAQYGLSSRQSREILSEGIGKEIEVPE